MAWLASFTRNYYVFAHIELHFSLPYLQTYPLKITILFFSSLTRIFYNRKYRCVISKHSNITVDIITKDNYITRKNNGPSSEPYGTPAGPYDGPLSKFDRPCSLYLTSQLSGVFLQFTDWPQLQKT